MLFTCAAAGAVAMYMADPQQGRRRRALARDRSAGFARHSSRRVGKGAKRLRATISGDVKGLRHSFDTPEPVANDQMLTDRVMSQVFRRPDIDHSRVNVNVEDGVAVLHGVLDGQDRIDELTSAVRRVPGVRDVVSYVHPPDIPAPAEGPRHFANGSSSNPVS
jgi:hypothetical protein